MNNVRRRQLEISGFLAKEEVISANEYSTLQMIIKCFNVINAQIYYLAMLNSEEVLLL